MQTTAFTFVRAASALQVLAGGRAGRQAGRQASMLRGRQARQLDQRLCLHCASSKCPHAAVMRPAVLPLTSSVLVKMNSSHADDFGQRRTWDLEHWAGWWRRRTGGWACAGMQ